MKRLASLALLSVCLSAAMGLACDAPSEGEATAMSAQNPSACPACHMDDYQAVSHPMHPGKKPVTCDVCHTQDSWHPSRLDHKWTLDGAHANVDCFQCHSGQPAVFRGTSKACDSCHEDDFDRANAKISWHDQVGKKCEECHSTAAWTPSLPHYDPGHPDASTPPPKPSATPTASATATSVPSAHPTVTAHPTVKPHPHPPVVKDAGPPLLPPDPEIITSPSHRG